MPTEMPTLGAQPKKSPVPGVVITALVVGAVAGGFYWWKNRAAEAPPAAAAVAAIAAAPAPGPVAVAEGTVAQAPSVPVAAPAEAKPAAKAEDSGLKSFRAEIHGPLEQAVVTAVGKGVGQPLTQVVNRSLVWWMKVPGDLLKGDELQVVYEERANAEPLVHAVRFTSKKFGKTFEAYRFKAKDEVFPRFYEPSGDELEQRLVDGPLDSWEQVTSLLKDGRKHKGVDFKTSVGSEVKATFDGTIVSKNWNFRGNGNSLKVEESGGKGRTALFLHLSELPKSVIAGQKVKKGEVIARSGNSGHSFAPHLHYQLMQGEKVIDPFESHKTIKKSIEPAEKVKLDAEVSRLKGLIGAVPGQIGGGFGRP
ncbi:MAG: peptidase [Myxococcaceae bacterium]|nr:peptidase [Myxococcaceae bacterium]